ncbi:hypothetical protein [Actinoplanes sp. NPDC051851]|uniref:hypothetical protein n=1 Tax=Actinoplanes sp. NPDC051851 TaxID=3154753 RepID=UPI00341F780F
MNPELRELIEELRTDLAVTGAGAEAWAHINAGAPAERIPAGTPQPVRELLEVADGIGAGPFELISLGMYDHYQGLLQHMPDFTGVADDPGAWFHLGTMDEEPLLLRRDTGEVWWVPPTSTDEWFAREEFAMAMPSLEFFLVLYVFGPRYADVAFDEFENEETDRWWAFLEEHDLTTVPGDDDYDDDDEETGA